MFYPTPPKLSAKDARWTVLFAAFVAPFLFPYLIYGKMEVVKRAEEEYLYQDKSGTRNYSTADEQWKAGIYCEMRHIRFVTQ